jgi:hypothetical protein
MRALARFEPERGFRFATYALTADPATLMWEGRVLTTTSTSIACPRDDP